MNFAVLFHVTNALSAHPLSELSCGCSQEYRLNQNQIEFRNGDGTWRVLNEEDLQFHHILHTEVAKWLMKE